MNTKMKIRVKTVIGFVLLEVVFVICNILGINAVTKVAKMEEAEALSYIQGYELMLGVFTLLVILTATWTIFDIAKHLRAEAKALTEAADKLSLGQADFKLDYVANDEFIEVVDSINKVVENSKKNADIAAEVADGNLTVNVKPASEGDVLGNALKKMVKRNYSALSNINEAALQVMTSSSQVASASEALAQGSTEQASAIEQITVSIDDISKKTNENAVKAGNAKELMDKVMVEVNDSNEKMQSMVVAMGDINKSSENIAKIIKVIDDIAFQTNILALNAAVEAARAGEVGKGFAVVAEEVRSLAAKSAQAAAETAELIENSIKSVEAGSKIAVETADALETVTGGIRETQTIVTGIAEASTYQANAISQVDQAIEQVSQVVQTNSATSEECAAASIELSGQSKKMRELISVYKLGKGSSEDSWRSEEVSERNEQIISLKDGFGKY